MFHLRQKVLINFIAEGRIQCLYTEVTLSSKDEFLLHNAMQYITHAAFTSIFAYKDEDIEVDESGIHTDPHSLKIIAPITRVERYRRPENKNCICCALEKEYSNDDMAVQILPWEFEIVNNAGTPLYPLSMINISNGRISNSVMLFTDKKEKDGSTLIAYFEDDDVTLSKNFPVSGYKYTEGSTDIPNELLCDRVMVMALHTGELAYVKD